MLNQRVPTPLKQILLTKLKKSAHCMLSQTQTHPPLIPQLFESLGIMIDKQNAVNGAL